MSKNPQRSFLVRPLSIANSKQAREIFAQIGVDAAGVEAMLEKTRHHNILIEAQECRVANIIKQGMLAVGGDAAVSRGVVACSVAHSDILLMGSAKQLRRFCEKISQQPFGLAELAHAVVLLLDAPQEENVIWRTARREISLGERTLIMGVINTTPDSFSDGGMFSAPPAAVTRALQMVEEGVDIIDIGAASSRPGATPISAEEEWRRLALILSAIAPRLGDIPLSIDTTRAEIARRALDEGVEIINDISALRFDAAMVELVATSRAGVVLMHMRGEPQTMQQGEIRYGDVVGDISHFLQERADWAQRRGVARASIVLDPGIGFGKRFADNIAIINRLSEFAALGFPLLLGASRKAFLGALTGEEVPARRLAASLAAHCVAALGGAHIVRVHDVAETKKALLVVDAIRQNSLGVLPPKNRGAP